MKTILTLTFLLLSPMMLWGFSVNPMVVEIDPQGAKSQKIYVLTNPSDSPKPVEISVAKPYVDDNDIETLKLSEGEDLFLIIPQQLTLPPNSRRSVKVFYVGDPIEEEDTYRIIFRELPVHIASEQDGDAVETNVDMKIVMEYQTRVWLTPGGLKQDLDVIAFESSEDQMTKKPILNLRVANNGQRHGYLKNLELLLLTNKGKKFTLSKEQIRPMLGQVLLKESEKSFVLNWQSDFPEIDSISEIRIKTRN